MYLHIRNVNVTSFFCAGIVRVPKLYANFVEDQYMSVFAIALPYTNPFKYVVGDF